MVVLLVMIQVFYYTNTREYTNIRSCRGKFVFDSSRLEEQMFVHALVNCTIKLTYFTLRDVSYNARWFWTTIRYGPMTTAYLCWTTGNGFKMTDLGFWTTVERGNTHRRRRK